MVFAWLILGVVLLAFEIHHFAFYALFGAIGAFAAAVVALIAPSAIPLQVAVAVLAAVIGIVVVRPQIERAPAQPARGEARSRGPRHARR